MSFSQLRISSDILKGLKDVKIDTPSPLQKKVANAMKRGGDLLVQTSGESQPETGYLVPILDHIARQDRRQGTKAILLTQRAEHAAEIEIWIQAAGKHAGIESLVVTESGNGEKQRNGLSAGPAIIIATPAWFAELLEENRMIFREAKYLVLDGADDISEWEAVDVINKRIIGNCQRIATVNRPEEDPPKELVSFLNEPETVSSRPIKTSPDPETLSIPKQLTQYYIKVPPRRKISTLMARLEEEGENQVLIFTASRRTADRLYRILKKNNLQAVSLGKDLDEETFADRMKRFTDQEARYLIAGELSAGDLPLDTISKIINYDVPEEVGEYKLRADLTSNEEGTRIVSLVSKQDRSDIKEIIEQLGYAPEELPLPEEVDSSKNGQQKKQDEKKGSRGKSRQKGTNKKRSGQRSSSRRSKKPRPGSVTKKAGEPSGLPKPSYEKLSGGRSGEKKTESKGVLGFFKKLFS